MTESFPQADLSNGLAIFLSDERLHETLFCVFVVLCKTAFVPFSTLLLLQLLQ